MIRNDLARAIRQLASERNLPEDVIMSALEAAMVAAYKKTPEAWAQNIRIGVDPSTGESRVYAQLAIVEEIQDSRTQISLEEARRIDPDSEPGGIVEIDVTPKDFGRIAAQTAKQVILQKIREAEREATYHTYADREGEIVQGTIQNLNPDGITVGLDRVEALLPRTNMMPSEKYPRNQRIRVYVQEVRKTPKGPEIIVSRTHKNMLRRLMEVEVPEIYNGTVEIKAIAREAGSRSKVAVAARQEGVDPVGACVGIRGVRIQALVNELSGEKIDVVAWSPDPSVFIANALSPAQVTNVRLVEIREGRTAEVIVPDEQLSLAIGKEGQNARLAAKLTGWRIDIKSESEATQEALRRIQEEARRQEELKALEAARALLAEAEAKEAEEAARREAEAKEGPLVKEVEAVDVEAVGELTTVEDVTAVEVAPTSEAEVAEGDVAPEVAGEPGVQVEDELPPSEPAGVEVAPVEETAGDVPPLEPVDGLPGTEDLGLDVDWEEVVSEDDGLDEEKETSSSRKSKKKKHRSRRLEYDRRLGEVVTRRHRKPSRRHQRWEAEIDYWDEGEGSEDDEDWNDEDYEAYLDYYEQEDEDQIEVDS